MEPVTVAEILGEAVRCNREFEVDSHVPRQGHTNKRRTLEMAAVEDLAVLEMAQFSLTSARRSAEHRS